MGEELLEDRIRLNHVRQKYWILVCYSQQQGNRQVGRCHLRQINDEKDKRKNKNVIMSASFPISSIKF